jgi:hypothetical protein
MLGAEALRTLAFAWVAAGTAVVERRDPVPLGTDIAETRHWQALYRHLESLVPPRDADTPYATRLRHWLTSLAVFLMPESGLLDGPPLNALDGMTHLVEFWQQQQQARLIRRQRGVRLAQLIKNGLSELAEQLRQKLPGSVNTQLRPGRDFVARLARVPDPGAEEETDSDTESPSTPPPPTA